MAKPILDEAGNQKFEIDQNDLMFLYALMSAGSQVRSQPVLTGTPMGPFQRQVEHAFDIPDPIPKAAPAQRQLSPSPIPDPIPDPIPYQSPMPREMAGPIRIARSQWTAIEPIRATPNPMPVVLGKALGAFQRDPGLAVLGLVSILCMGVVFWHFTRMPGGAVSEKKPAAQEALFTQ